ncbi:MAG: hypothetical protein HYR96_08815 [Deltaproteobacteria bacterium]|nr:hypothetical protein [Deltaproteobacteria bacterium]MBI3293856.1 hypothetical protein [Deltaproteobacteria bacterium]
MKLLMISGLTSLLLLGCLDKMEKVTSDTRDAVLDTRNMAQLATALEILHDEGNDDMALRAVAAEGVFLLAPEDRIHKYIGCRYPLNVGADPDTKYPNVTRVFRSGSYGPEKAPPIDPGVSAPKSPVVYAIMEHAVLTLLNDLAQVANKDLPNEKLEDYRGKARRMIPIATAIFGARVHMDMEKYFRDVETIASLDNRNQAVKLKSLDIRTKGARLLRRVVAKYQIEENDINTLRVLMSERMGFDYNLID